MAGTYIYNYDANGNMISGAGRTIDYDFENRPTSIVKGGVTTSFLYDGDGGRVQKTAGSTTTTYIGKLYVCDNGTCTKMIFAGGQRIAQKEVTGGATSYYHPDHLGSTSVVTDSAGNNEQDLAYYPYGDTFLDVGSKDVKFKYTGKERDDSTDLYFYEARYYDPFLGRFISADSIVPNPLDPQALNRYSYVLNNPIIYTDPTGNSFGRSDSSSQRLQDSLGSFDSFANSDFFFSFFDRSASRLARRIADFQSTISASRAPNFSNQSQPGGGGFFSTGSDSLGLGGINGKQGTGRSSSGNVQLAFGPIILPILAPLAPYVVPALELTFTAVEYFILFNGLVDIFSGIIDNERGSLGRESNEVYHYTNSRNIDSILKESIEARKRGIFTTTNGNLSPLQAQIELALPPNRGSADAVFKIDLNVVRESGVRVSEPRPIQRLFNMPGGGEEIIIYGKVPPNAITRVK